MKNYKIFRMIIAIFVATVVGLSVSLGAIIPAFLAILMGVLLSYIYKKTTNEVLYDERIVKTRRIIQKCHDHIFNFCSIFRTIPYNFKGYISRLHSSRLHFVLCCSSTGFITSSIDIHNSIIY